MTSTRCAYRSSPRIICVCVMLTIDKAEWKLPHYLFSVSSLGIHKEPCCGISVDNYTKYFNAHASRILESFLYPYLLLHVIYTVGMLYVENATRNTRRCLGLNDAALCKNDWYCNSWFTGFQYVIRMSVSIRQTYPSAVPHRSQLSLYPTFLKLYEGVSKSFRTEPWRNIRLLQ
jgi:hypothetical protein